MPIVSVPLKWRLALVLAVLSVSACSTAPLTVTSPVATPTLALSGKLISPTLTPTTMPEKSTVVVTVKPSADPVREAVVADWEEMFRTTQSYEYVKANGRPDDKTWWIEQAKRFYIGRARANYVEQINMMFRPDVPSAPGFLGNARDKAAVQSCPSVTECVVQVNLESGTYWAYDIRQQVWQQANPAQPITWTIAMQYNPDLKRWMIK
jgi:hypothetical protein